MESSLLLNFMQSRRSIRQFTELPVCREQILMIIEAARWAPSNHNRQGWKFLVYDNRKEIRELGRRVKEAFANHMQKLPEMAASYASHLVHYATFFSEAPVLIVALHKQPASISAPLLKDVHNASLVSGEALSTAMAVQNLQLAAHNLGLGTCVMTAPLLVPDVWQGLNLPQGFDLTCFVVLGHPSESPSPPHKKELDQIVEFRNDPEVPVKL